MRRFHIVIVGHGISMSVYRFAECVRHDFSMHSQQMVWWASEWERERDRDRERYGCVPFYNSLYAHSTHQSKQKNANLVPSIPCSIANAAHHRKKNVEERRKKKNDPEKYQRINRRQLESISCANKKLSKLHQAAARMMEYLIKINRPPVPRAFVTHRYQYRDRNIWPGSDRQAIILFCNGNVWSEGIPNNGDSLCGSLALNILCLDLVLFCCCFFFFLFCITRQITRFYWTCRCVFSHNAHIYYHFLSRQVCFDFH